MYIKTRGVFMYAWAWVLREAGVGGVGGGGLENWIFTVFIFCFVLPYRLKQKS